MGITTDFLLLGIVVGFSLGFSLRDFLQHLLDSKKKHSDDGGKT